ncbi:MAG: hypothetical protein FWG50_12110 [Kiritimatiellaeota bacterium]|nr:hypothetical protein [Kiritimatiellota bacterium]
MKKLMLILSFSHLSAFAETNGITLALYFPHTEMLMEEWYDFSITLSNGSARAVYVINDPKTALARQLIFDLGMTGKREFSKYDFDDNPLKWNVGPTSTRHRVIPVPPGETHTWDFIYGYATELLGAIRGCCVTSMVARCTLENKQWVQSNTVQLKFYPDELLTPIFDENTTPKFERLYKARLGEKTYLFNHVKMRICELPEDDMPDIQRNTNEGSIISFPNSKRKILYDPKTWSDSRYEYEGNTIRLKR